MFYRFPFDRLDDYPDCSNLAFVELNQHRIDSLTAVRRHILSKVVYVFVASSRANRQLYLLRHCLAAPQVQCSHTRFVDHPVALPGDLHVSGTTL